MINGFNQEQEERLFSEDNRDNLRKPYHKPFLEELGDLRDITLGGSLGVGESGSHYPVGHKSTHLKVQPLPEIFDSQKTEQVKKNRK